MSLQSKLLALTLLAAPLLAQNTGFGVSIALTHASELTTTTPNYNAVTEQLQISGTASFPVTGGNPSDYHVRVQNQFVAINPTADPKVYSFTRPIPMGPTAPPNGWSTWAYAAHFADTDHVTKPILVELIETATNIVVARQRVVLLDKRQHPAMEVQSLRGLLAESLGMEITSQGLDRMEALARSVHPQPSLTRFNQSLSTSFAGLSVTQAMDTTFGNNPSPTNPASKACVPLNSVPNEIRQNASYDLFLTNVNGAYVTYLAAKQQLETGSIGTALSSLLGPAALLALAVDGAAQYIESSSCVVVPPIPANFEVCASSLKGDSRTLAIDSVNSVDLSIGTSSLPPANFLARSTVSNLAGTVDGQITNIFFRYSGERTNGCNDKYFRPSVSIPANQINLFPNLVNWSSCRALGLRTESAVQSATSQYNFEDDSSSLERHRISLYAAPSPSFALAGNRTNSTNVGICSQPGFTYYAGQLLNKFYTRSLLSLENTWKSGSPNTQQATAMDLVFSRWETGIFGDINITNGPGGSDHILTQNFNRNASKNFNDRIQLRLNTDAKRTVSAGLSPAWVYPAPEFYPCTNVQFPCLTNRSFFNELYDVSYSVTTGALNQVIKELAAGPMLTFTWQPTYQDLGIVPKQGSSPTDIAVLDGPALSQLDINFAQLGPTAVSVVVTPTIMPFTYINPEPSNIPNIVLEGDAKLTYQLAQLKVDLVASGPTPLANGRWMSMLLDFHDPNLDLRPATSAAANRLDPVMSQNAGSSITVLQSGFSGCPIGPVIAPFQPPPPGVPVPHPTCAAGMASSLTAALRPVITQRLTNMLSRFPAPLQFDAAGQGSPVLNFNPLRRYQWTNIITYYGNLQ